MKLLLALLLLVSTCSFIKWYSPPTSPSWQNLRRTTPLCLLEDGGADDSSGKNKISSILGQLAEAEVDEKVLKAIDRRIISDGVQAGCSREILQSFKEGDLIRKILKIPLNSKVTYGRVGEFLGQAAVSFMRDFIQRAMTDNLFCKDEKDSKQNAVKEFQRSLFPDPSLIVGSLGPLEYFLSYSRGEGNRKNEDSVSLSADGEFEKVLFELFRNQHDFDAATCLIEGREGMVMVLVGSSESAVEAGIGALELRIAEIVRNSFNEIPINWDDNKLIALYMKYRVIPTWFANHREELSKLVGLSSSENQQS